MPGTPRASFWSPGPVAAAWLVLGAIADPAGRGLQLAVAGALIVALGAAGWRLAGRMLPWAPAASRAVAALCCAVFLARTCATVLGHFGVLRPSLALGCVGLACGLALVLRPGVEPRPPAANPRGTGPPSALLVATGAVLLFGAFLLGREIFYAAAGRFQFDDTSYHLTAVATWLRHADLRMVRFAYGDPSTSFYPIGGELVSWLLLAPFRDSDLLARWSELPFVLGCLLATASIGRTLGLSARWTGFAVVALAAIPRLLPLAFGAGNDFAAAFFALAAVDAALLLGGRPRAVESSGSVTSSASPGWFASFASGASCGGCAAFALALGLLVGTKYTGILLAPPILILGALALVLHPAWRWRPVVGPLAFVACLGIAAGGYTYVRNVVSTGNPVFPAPVTVLGVELLAGWRETGIAARMDEPWTKLAPWAYFLEQRASLGPLFSYLLVPGALLAPLLAFRSARAGAAAAAGGEDAAGPGALVRAVALALPVSWFLIFVFLVHDQRDVRYILAALAIGALACARLLAALPPWLGTPCAALGLLVTLLVRLRLLTDSEVTARFLTGGLVFGATLACGAWWIARRGLPRPGRRLASAATLAGLAVLPAAGPAVARYQQTKLAAEPPAAALEALAPRGAVVAYLGLNAPYHFFGSALQNELHILPTTADPREEFHDWGARPVRPVQEARPRRWLRRLETRGVEYVVVELAGDVEPYRSWMAERPERFERVHGHGSIEIWRVVRMARMAQPEAPAAGGSMPGIEPAKRPA